MTSTLLTESIAPALSARACAPLLLLRAVARGVAELLALLDGGSLDLRPHHVLHHRHPLGHEVPLLAVPLLEHHRPRSLVVLARHLDGMREALHPELLEPL